MASLTCPVAPSIPYRLLWLPSSDCKINLCGSIMNSVDHNKSDAPWVPAVTELCFLTSNLVAGRCWPRLGMGKVTWGKLNFSNCLRRYCILLYSIFHTHLTVQTGGRRSIGQCWSMSLEYFVYNGLGQNKVLNVQLECERARNRNMRKTVVIVEEEVVHQIHVFFQCSTLSIIHVGITIH